MSLDDDHHLIEREEPRPAGPLTGRAAGFCFDSGIPLVTCGMLVYTALALCLSTTYTCTTSHGD